MNAEEFSRRLRAEMNDVHMDAPLRRETISRIRGKERTVMKRKMPMALAFALLMVMLCAAALAMAGRWSMMDFIGQYSKAIPEDADAYIHKNVATMENERVRIEVRELYYDGVTSRMTVDVIPKEKNTLLLGEGVMLEDPFIDLTHEYVMDGENDMRSVYEIINERGYAQVYTVNVATLNDREGVDISSMDYMLGEDGTLTIYEEVKYLSDLPEREVELQAILMPFTMPVTEDAYADYGARETLGTTLTLKASAKETSEPTVYMSSEPVEFASVGVRVNRLTATVKPHEIYATIEYEVIDAEKYAQIEGGLWFEWIDPDSAEEEPYKQRLAAGMSGSASSQDLNEEGTLVCQRDNLALTELRDCYVLRAYNAWSKERYETQVLTMRPATAKEAE